MVRVCWMIVVLIVCASGSTPACGQETRKAQLMEAAQKALESGKGDTALQMINDALRTSPKNLELLLFRAEIQSSRGEYEKAVEDASAVIAAAPKWANAINFRGQYRFQAGDFAGSVEDFDRYLELRPEVAPAHWQRGISLYFAGKFAEGRDQFAAFQTVNDADVENAVWHYLCNQQVVGKEQAQKEIPPTKLDRRVPLMKVYDLFLGKGSVEAVEKEVKESVATLDEIHRRDFYMNLYLGLYFVSEDQKDKALEYFKKAAHPVHARTDYRYMWHAARVYVKLLETPKTEEGQPNR